MLNQPKFVTTRVARALLVAAFAIAAWVTWRWMSEHRLLYIYDPADHLNEAVMFARHPLDYLTVINLWWAPLYHILLGSLLWLTDGAVRSSIGLVNLGFLALLVWSTFKIGESLHSAISGVVAAFILMTYPAIFIHLRHPMIDLPLTALTSVTVMALMRCGRFEDRRSILVGVLGGLGMLTKQSFAAAIVLPAAYSVSRLLSRRGLAHATLALTVALAIALPFYYPRLGFYMSYWQEHQKTHALALGHLGPGTQFGLVAELIGIWHQTSLGLAAAWLLALPGFLRSEHRAVPAIWFLGTLAFATSLPLRDSRYLMPALPAIALMTSVGLMRGRRPAVTIGFTLVFGALQLWAVSFDSPWWPRGVAVSNGVEPSEPFQFFTRGFNLLGPPSPDPDGLGVAAGLSAIEGRIGVFGHRIVRDAIASQHVAPRGSPRVESISLISSCTDPSLPQMDYVVWQVGGPSEPDPSRSPADCLIGFQQVGRLKVTRPDFMLGTRELLLMAPLRPKKGT